MEKERAAEATPIPQRENNTSLPISKPRYIKSLDVKMLGDRATDEAKRLHPNTPERFIARREFTDKTANGLTNCVIQHIRLEGGQAERIANMGRRVDTSHTFEDVTGRTRTIGGSKWIKGTGTNGSADISATIDGRSVKIEIKCAATNDRQSECQKQYQQDVEKAGGLYFIASTFAGFLAWYNQTFKP
jgi:hypothetical protein